MNCYLMIWFKQACLIKTLLSFGTCLGKCNGLALFVSSKQFYWINRYNSILNDYSNLYNKYNDVEPHEGYSDLLEILQTLKGDKWFLYHEGLDLLYERAGMVFVNSQKYYRIS